MDHQLEREPVPERHRRFDAFLDRLQKDVYPEPTSALHTRLTKQMIGHLLEGYELPDRARVLDIGCGQGPALHEFSIAGHEAVGIALGSDVEVCRAKGFEVHEMDQSFLEFPDERFDLVWCRHALEHSPMPLFTLGEFRRVLRSKGLLYVEVPAPDTCARHEANPNHYSVLGSQMWAELFVRSGFEILESLELRIPLAIGEDRYFSFVCRRGS